MWKPAGWPLTHWAGDWGEGSILLSPLGIVRTQQIGKKKLYKGEKESILPLSLSWHPSPYLSHSLSLSPSLRFDSRMINYQSWLYSRLMIERVGSSHVAAAPLTGIECKRDMAAWRKAPKGAGVSLHICRTSDRCSADWFPRVWGLFLLSSIEAEGLLRAVFKDDLFICDVIDYSAFWSFASRPSLGANDQTDLDFNIVSSDSA